MAAEVLRSFEDRRRMARDILFGEEAFMPLTVKEVQTTPNPNAMKFVLDGRITTTPASFFNAEAAGNHPIASRLFAIPGVQSVLLLGDFITVNKAPGMKWTQMTAKVKRALADVLKDADRSGS